MNNKLIFDEPVQEGILLSGFLEGDAANYIFLVDKCEKLEDGRYEVTLSQYNL